MLRPGGVVMGFFCSLPIESATFTKYEIVDDTSLRHRRHPGSGGPKRVLQNRDVIRMFEGLNVSESFLLKSNTREMLLRRSGAAQPAQPATSTSSQPAKQPAQPAQTAQTAQTKK
jgi:hypothetical protein